MKQITWIVLSWFMLTIHPSASASEQSFCSGKPLSEARSLSDLPNEVTSLLGQSRTGVDGIADQGGKFNVTDVVDVRLPMRRFIIAGLNSNCALVAIERGGRGYSIELIAFGQNNGKWQMMQRRYLGKMPQSLEDLLTDQESLKHDYKPSQGYVPNAETAVKIAVAVWEPIYGEDQIAHEKPYTAVLLNGIWTVQGSLPKGFVGGVAIAEIAKADGRVIRVSHGK